jgi:hypothetical protein
MVKEQTVASCAVYTVPAAVRHGDIADTHTAPSHTDAKRRQQRSEPSRGRLIAEPNPWQPIQLGSRLGTHDVTHRPGHARASHIMLHHHNFHELRQRILSSLESLRKLQELT